MSDPTREVQRYLDQPLDELMQQFDLYAEETSGVQRGPGAAWEQDRAGVEAEDLRRGQLVRTAAGCPL